MRGSQVEFSNFAREMFSTIYAKMEEKGEQYTGDMASDAFYNFKHAASEWDTWVQYEILQFAQKHWTFMVRWAKADRQFVEKESMVAEVRDSAQDMIVYMLLLLFWIETHMIFLKEE